MLVLDSWARPPENFVNSPSLTEGNIGGINSQNWTTTQKDRAFREQFEKGIQGKIKAFLNLGGVVISLEIVSYVQGQNPKCPR